DYFLQTWPTDPEFELSFAKLRRHDSEFRECCRAGGRCHHGIFIDVFPFDAVSTTHWWGRLHLQAILLERRLRDFIQDPRRRLASRATPLRKRGLKRLANARLRRNPEPRWRAAQERRFTLLRHTAAESVTCLASSPSGPAGLRSRIRPRSELAQSVEVPFATARFPPPRAYHDTLTRLHGDYRRLPPPKSQRPSHPIVAFRTPSPEAQTAMPAGLPSGKAPVRQLI
ncbi:MAG: LicD family protein, partial [Planctomycetota bacterium]